MLQAGRTSFSIGKEQSAFLMVKTKAACHKTFSAHFLRKSLATKLFRLISLRNRPPQTFLAHFLRKSLATNFFSSFPQEIGRHKTFSAHFLEEIARHKTFSAYFLRKSPATNFFGSFPQEIARHETVSAHFLRKSLTTNFFISSGNRSPLTHSFPQEIVGWPTSNSRYWRGGQVFLSVKSNPRF